MATSSRPTSTTGSSTRYSPRVRLSTVVGDAIRWTVLLAVAVAIVVPIGFAFMSGFRTTGAIRNDPAGLPDPWSFDHYVNILTGGTYWQQLASSPPNCPTSAANNSASRNTGLTRCLT